MRKKDYNNRSAQVGKLIAENLKRLRGGMYKTELARKVKLSRGTIERLEKGGEGKLPRLETLAKIANALEVDIGELFRKPEKEIDVSAKLDIALDRMIYENGYFIQLLDRYFERKVKELKK